MTVRATSFADPLKQATATIQLSAPQPSISRVATAAGETPTVAPNTWIEIKGTNLAPHARVWRGSDFVKGQMPTQLDGVSATVNGKSAYVYYISPTQVNVLTSLDQSLGTVQIQIDNGGGAISSSTVQMAEYAPGFFVINGGKYAAATHANGSLLGPVSLYPGSTTPAKPGETIVLYANGFGPTAPPVVEGSAAQNASLPQLPAVSIGGLPAIVKYAGVVSPGLYQFNVVIPDAAPDGDNALTAQYGGLSTQTGVVITVQH